MGHEQHVARITTNPEACITILLQKATGFWQVVVSMYNIADSIQELEYYWDQQPSRDRFRLNHSRFVLLALEMFLEMVLA